MVSSNEKLAASLEELRQLQGNGARVFASEQLTRTTRERLVKHGFLLEAMKGWLISSSPDTRPGDTTPWFASFWEFCTRYCTDRFGDAWYVSPEQSLLLHEEATVVPKQVVIHSPAANNNRIELPFGTSFFALKQRQMPAPDELAVLSTGVRAFTVEAGLVRVPNSFFTDHPIEAQLALERIREPSVLLRHLLDGGHAVVAGRLAGALRRIGRGTIADEIVRVMRSAEHGIRESDPLDPDQPIVPGPRQAPPSVARLHALWAATREAVLSELPVAPRQRPNPTTYLAKLDKVYKLDAYHSLSIEGYQVTTELIERVAAGTWDLDQASSVDRNALAARGYWLAFERVRDTVRRILRTEESGKIVRVAHREWYRELFAPHVAAGLLPAGSLAGYRSQPIYLRGSRHVPPRWEVVGDAMHALFDLVEAEPEPGVRAVLGHWLVGYVHPFPDGNGRVARFVMNTLLAEGGYPWTVIRVEDRTAYLDALERASVGEDVGPFARFIAKQLQPSQRKAARTRSRVSRPRRR
jgi:Fic family protein